MEKIYSLTKEQYLHNKNTWSKYHTLKASGQNWQHLLWLLMTNRNIKKSFNPISSLRKIEKFNLDKIRRRYRKLEEATSRLTNHLNSVKKFIQGDESYRKWNSTLKEDRITLYFYYNDGIDPAGRPILKLTEDLFFFINLQLIDELLEKLNSIHLIWEEIG